MNRVTWLDRMDAKRERELATLKPYKANGYLRGDLVTTATGRVAQITQCRPDGKLQAMYVSGVREGTILDRAHIRPYHGPIWQNGEQVK